MVNGGDKIITGTGKRRRIFMVKIRRLTHTIVVKCRANSDCNIFYGVNSTYGEIETTI